MERRFRALGRVPGDRSLRCCSQIGKVACRSTASPHAPTGRHHSLLNFANTTNSESNSLSSKILNTNQRLFFLEIFFFLDILQAGLSSQIQSCPSTTGVMAYFLSRLVPSEVCTECTSIKESRSQRSHRQGLRETKAADGVFSHGQGQS
jgi:hypothetical protein